MTCNPEDSSELFIDMPDEHAEFLINILNGTETDYSEGDLQEAQLYDKMSQPLTIDDFKNWQAGGHDTRFDL